MIATLPMYDWPERRAETDARWLALRDALRAEGFKAPGDLSRADEPMALWLSPDLLIGETCTYPLVTVLDGKVRYVATPMHHAPGCTPGRYRSAVVRRGTGNGVSPPATPDALIAPEAVAGRFAANMPESLSGFVALAGDMAATHLGEPGDGDVLWTGSHRASIRAVASGEADFAAIDCVSWAIALDHEPAARDLVVAGWTASRPGLPLITSGDADDEALSRIRRAVLSAMDAVILDDPFAISPLPDRRP